MSKGKVEEKNMPPKNKHRKGAGHGPPAMMGEKPKNFKKTFKQFLSLLGNYKVSIIVVLTFAIGSTIFAIVGPKILGQATTEIFDGLLAKIKGIGSIDFTAIGKILLFLLGLYSISALFSFIQGTVMAGISQKLSYKLRDDISKKINRMPLKYFDGKTHGEVLSRITNDVDTMSNSLNQGLTQVITQVVMLIGVLIMMFSINWIMTLVSILVIPIAMIFIGIIMKKAQPEFRRQQEFLGHVNGKVEETFGGHTVIKAFNKEKDVLEEFDELNNTLAKSSRKAEFLSGLMMPIMTFVGNISYVIISILGGYFVIKNSISVGDIQSFIQYVRSFNQPIAQIAQVANMLQSIMAAAERVFEFLDEEEEDQTVPNPVHIDGLEGKVDFRNVHFGYNEDKIIINNFTANIKPGQKVAIVGPTGAGKTTMIKLLMRFYDANDGAILIDGHNIKDFNRTELRDMFGMVLQDTWLFNGTIMENIRYGRLNATDEEVIKAAKAAHVHHFVKTLPDGYQMVLNEEASNVSQGQKQLLTIARAILADPKILILDEATSSVDTRTEIIIQKAMDNLMQGRTSFVIAHRLSTIRDADLILVMRDGDIVEQGNHHDLLEANGFYASLYNSQFEKTEQAV